MKKISLVMVLFLIPGLASAKVGLRNLEEDVKFRTVCVDKVSVNPGTGAAVSGVGNVIFSGSLASVSSIAKTSSVATLSTPAKLTIDNYDASANGTVVCTSVKIYGQDQFGNNIIETIAASETAANTTNVFATVDFVQASGCSGGATGDELQISQSLELGLTQHINSTSDVLTACIKDSSDSSKIKCAAREDGSTTDIQSAVSLSSHSIDFSKAMFSLGSKVAAADGDGVCFTVRSGK